MDGEVRHAFQRTVDEGASRVARTWPALLATGTVGGIDLGIGVLAMFIVREATGSHMLGALAFGIGFLALVLASSELFTENFLVPVAAVVSRDATVAQVLRLWGGTFVMNLAGGWVVMGIAMVAFPDLRAVAVEVGRFYPELGIGWRALALAVLGGTAITLMTWMERGTDSVPVKVVAAWAVAFLLVAGPLNHVIVASLEMFAALQSGAPFGYLDMAVAIAWAALGNTVGGLLLVTVLRLVQVGRAQVREEQRQPTNQKRRTEGDAA